jgi:hypothetical protein
LPRIIIGVLLEYAVEIDTVTIAGVLLESAVEIDAATSLTMRSNPSARGIKIHWTVPPWNMHAVNGSNHAPDLVDGLMLSGDSAGIASHHGTTEPGAEILVMCKDSKERI